MASSSQAGIVKPTDLVDLIKDKPVRSGKFKRIQPYVLPLQLRSAASSSAAPAPVTSKWKVSQGTLSISYHTRHLIPAVGQRVSERCYLFKDKIHSYEHCAGDIVQSIVCENTDPASPLAQIFITIHKQGQIALMAMPRFGVALQLCQALCGTIELPDIDKLNRPDAPNSDVFTFVYNAGYDRRARACLWVRCDHENEIRRLQSFMAAIDEWIPFSEQLRQIWQQVIEHAWRQLDYCRQIDRLDEYRETQFDVFSMPHSYWPENIKTQRKVIDEEIKCIKAAALWQPIALEKNDKKWFFGYPSQIPDSVIKRSSLEVYHPSSALKYIRGYPALHQLVLAGDIAAIELLLSHDPMAIYQRDFSGNLAIEVAACWLNDINITMILFNSWRSLTPQQQFAHMKFYRAINHGLGGAEHRSFLFKDKDRRRILIKKYFEDVFPGIDNPLGLYQAIQRHDEKALTKIQAEELNPWQQIIDNISNPDKVITIIAEQLPQRHGLFKAYLLNDWPMIQAQIDNRIPYFADLDMAITRGNWQDCLFYVKQPLLRDDERLQHCVRQLKPWCDFVTQIKTGEKQLDVLLKVKDKSLTQIIEIKRLQQQLYRLNRQKSQLEKSDKGYLAYRSYRQTVPKHWWNVKGDLPKWYGYLQALKHRLARMMDETPPSEQQRVICDFIKSELLLFSQLKHALLTHNEEAIAKLEEAFRGRNGSEKSWRGFYMNTRRLWNAHHMNNLYHDQFEDSSLPPHFDLYLDCITGDWESISRYAAKQLNIKKRQLAPFDNIESSQRYLHHLLPIRFTLHRKILNKQKINIDGLIQERRAFRRFEKKLNEIYLKEYTSVKQLLAAIPDEVKTIQLKRAKDYEPGFFNNGLLEKLRVYRNRIIVDEFSLLKLKQDTEEYIQELIEANSQGIVNTAATLAAFKQNIEAILAVKQQTLLCLQQAYVDYRPHCLAFECDFQIYTLALAAQIAAAQFKKYDDYKLPMHVDAIAHKVRQWEPRFNSITNERFIAIKQMQMCSVKAMLSLIRCGLLSYQRQDHWGYTPLQLAVIADNIVVVKLFFENKLADDWVKLNNSGYTYSTLLPYARSSQMMELLLHYYIDPNRQSFLFSGGDEVKLKRLISYGHKLIADDDGLTLRDKAIVNEIPYATKYLIKLFAYQKEAMPKGPYDPFVPAKHCEMMDEYCIKHELREKKIKELPKFKEITTDKSGNVEIHFDKGTIYCRERTVAQMSLQDKREMAIIFASSFCLPNDLYGLRTIYFYLHRIAALQHLKAFVYYKQRGAEPDELDTPVAFFLYQEKQCRDFKGKPMMAYKASIAACSPDYRDMGLMSMCFITLFKTHEKSKHSKLPLKFYGRFGQPGLAYLMLPPSAKVSNKYYCPPEEVQHLAAQFNNQVDAKGASMPPVFSLAVRRGKGKGILPLALEDFDLMSKKVGAGKLKSLPLKIDVDDALMESWYKMLEHKYKLTRKLLNDYIQQGIKADELVTRLTMACL